MERVEKLRDQLKNPAQKTLSLEQFLNLSKNAGTKLKSAGAVEKDAITRFIFLNLTIDEKKVISYEPKEPFKTLLENKKNGNFLSGGHD